MPKNVLLITIDSYRADHFRPLTSLTHSIEYPPESPTLESVYEEGTSFTDAYTTGPGTSPSFPALLTGTLPLSYGGLGPLKPDRPRLSKELGKFGLETAGFQCNPFLSRHFDYDQGYDEFTDYQNPLMGVATRIFPRGIEISNPKLNKVDDVLHITAAIKKSYQLIKGKPRPYVSAEVITDDTVEWLSGTDQPFFCWTHYMDVHHPCYPPEQYRKRYDVEDVTQSQVSEWYSSLLREPEALTKSEIESLKQLYSAAIEYTDGQIGRIIDLLKNEDRYEDTLVIITSDHGELFGEHGQYGKPERMYDELLHVPLIVANGPDYLENDANDLVSLLDIPPMIHDVLGFDIPEEYEGRRPKIDEPREYILAEHEVDGEVIVGARSRNWLYEGDEIHDEHRLFDLRDGDFEQVPVSEHPDLLEKKVVLNRLRELDVDTRRLEDEVEGDVQSRLEDLGYL
ncbi:sulfatase [Halomarina rubra]|uniref:Sulfatase n=1 Tax=Halomarina rubra TaxID=2071873 RepID=A0ABD6AX22_9EURY|nr:sulfatase [Halomarina rubra]